MGFIDFTNGEVLTADQMDTVLRQSVMKFADATARDTALSAVLAEGMMCYLDDTNEVLKYDGSSWIDISGDITGVTAGTALTGGGTSGNVTLDVDTTVVQPNVITTQGDLVIGDASGDPVRLPVGSADQVLTSDGTTVSFQDAAGGGAAGYTNLVNATSLSGTSFTVTGLSGYSSYLVVIKDLSINSDQDNIVLGAINGSNTGVFSTVSELINQSETSGSGTQGTTSHFSSEPLLAKVYSNTRLAHISILIENAGDTNACSFFSVGGPNGQSTTLDRNVVGLGKHDKNSQALDTITIKSQLGRTFDNGTISVWGA